MHEKPEPFEYNGRLFVRLPDVGLCVLASWGWQPVPGLY